MMYMSVDLSVSSEPESYDEDTDLDGFVVDSDDAVETVQTTEDQDEQEIVQQLKDVEHMGTRVENGRRRSTRVSKPTVKYQHPDFNKVYFTSGDEQEDWDTEDDADDDESEEWTPSQ